MGAHFRESAKVKNWIPAFAGMTLLASGIAHAEPAFSRLYKQQYGYTPSCNACHKDGGGTPVNAYGQQFKDAGMTLAAFAKIAGLDADGDGYSNETEARARSNPGNPRSKPGDAGDWLDIASLIPREVQAVFPGVRTWLPRDAILTEREITRAKEMGAVLTAADENTIYIPLVDQRPAGTALIFPAVHQGKVFFLLLATDRNLNVTLVQPLDTRHVPAAERSRVYDAFKGVAVDQLPAAQGEGLDAAITAAVKKAGTLLYVRLKNV
jgi:hypothetical protein